MIESPEAQYRLLGQLVREMPEFPNAGLLGREHLMWLGKVTAIVNSIGDDIADKVYIKNIANRMLHPPRRTEVESLSLILFRTLATAELKAPTEAHGAFIPVGNAFDALAAIAKVLQEAKNDILIVDPYMDEKALTDFAILAPDTASIRLLADKSYYKPSLKPATEAWVKQNGAKRAIEVRLASPKSLHDRLIMIDKQYAYILTQSLNAFASRSPASIIRADVDTSALKISAYADIWASAQPL